MNLGIEYLIRTGAIRKFFQAPCTLFIEHWLGNRLIISIEKKLGRSKFYRISHYHFESLAEDGRLPNSEECDVLKDEIFSSDKIVIPGDYVLLPYAEQSIINDHNRYNHPMDVHTYNRFLNRYLYSERHKQQRENWLWKMFVNLHYKRPILDLYSYERSRRAIIVMMEKEKIQQEDHEKWAIWIMWRKKFLRSTRVAPELIFQSAYQN